MNKNRFEAFTEGVFAFAFTLLALTFVLPEIKIANDRTLTAALLRLWPNLAAYALSLMVIGIMWQNHQALFRMVQRIDRKTIFWNLLLLGGLAFIPFVTSTLGTYPTLRPSTFLYGVTLSYCSTMYNLMLDHLVRTRAFLPEITPRVIRQTANAYRVGWFGYTSAMTFGLVANREKTLDSVKLARALGDFELPPEVKLQPNKCYYRAGDHQLMTSAFVGSAQSTGKDDPEDLFHVDQVVAGDKTAPAVTETGCKLTMPS